MDTTDVFCEGHLSNNDYISGNAFTMTDCAYFAPLFYAQQLHSFAEKPRLMARPSIQKMMAVLQAMNSK